MKKTLVFLFFLIGLVSIFVMAQPTNLPSVARQGLSADTNGLIYGPANIIISNWLAGPGITISTGAAHTAVGVTVANTVASGGSVTNLSVYSSNAIYSPLTVHAYTGGITNEQQWLDTNGAVGIAVSKNAAQLLLPGGSAAAPAWSFVDDQNTGFYLGASDVLGVSTAGGLRSRWSSSGLELINTPFFMSDVSALNPVYLYRDAANQLALRNGTASNSFAVYKTYENAGVDYERFRIYWNAATATVGTEKGGTGSNRDVYFIRGGENRLALSSSGVVSFDDLLWASDNTFDIGASGANRPRSSYVATASYAPQFRGLLGTRLLEQADGVWTISDSSNTDFKRLQFGGTSSSYPALMRTNSSLVLLGADGVASATNQLLFGDSASSSPAIARVLDPTDGIKLSSSEVGIIFNGATSVSFDTARVLQRSDSGYFSIGSAADVRWYRDSSGVFHQRFGTRAQTNRIAGNYTDASNWDALETGYDATKSANFVRSQALGSHEHKPLILTAHSAHDTVTINTNGNTTITGVVNITDGFNPLTLSGGFMEIEGAAPQFVFADRTGGEDDYRISLNGGLLVIGNTTDGTTNIAINGSGNVGIGTNSPQTALHVHGGMIVNKRLRIYDGTKALTESAATGIADVVVAANEHVGGAVVATVFARDATDLQTRTITFNYSGLNVAGTVTANISAVVESATVTAGTLTVTPTVTDSGGGAVRINLNAVSSLTQTNLDATWQIQANGTGGWIDVL